MSVPNRLEEKQGGQNGQKEVSKGRDKARDL